MKTEEEVKWCDIHKVWYTEGMPCKPCKQDKPKQEKTK